MPTYQIHDNGGRPFEVVVRGQSVEVLVNVDCENDIYKPFRTWEVLDVFVGEDAHYPGNSILLHSKGNQYIYIGNEIYSFSVEKGEKIELYFSLVGNSDVPYPVAVGTKNVYFMLDSKFVPLDMFPEDVTYEELSDAYSLFYYRDLEYEAEPMWDVKVIHERLW